MAGWECLRQLLSQPEQYPGWWVPYFSGYDSQGHNEQGSQAAERQRQESPWRPLRASWERQSAFCDIWDDTSQDEGLYIWLPSLHAFFSPMWGYRRGLITFHRRHCWYKASWHGKPVLWLAQNRIAQAGWTFLWALPPPPLLHPFSTLSPDQSDINKAFKKKLWSPSL